MNLADKRVLVIGSSSIGENGIGTLARALKLLLPKTKLVFVGKSGMGLAGNAANRLAGTPQQREAFDTTLSSNLPYDIVLVVIGGNPSGSKANIEDAMGWIKSRVDKRGARLLWVGPPVYARTFAQSVMSTFDEVGPRTLGDDYASSSDWTSRDIGRTADGVHFTSRGAQLWGEEIVKWMNTRRDKNSNASVVNPAIYIFGAVALLLSIYFMRNKA